MSDTAPRTQGSAPQMLADALLRSVAGTSASLRVTGATTDSNQSELGLVATAFSQIVVSPVVLRSLRPAWKENEPSRWELLVSATSATARSMCTGVVNAVIKERASEASTRNRNTHSTRKGERDKRYTAAGSLFLMPDP